MHQKRIALNKVIELNLKIRINFSLWFVCGEHEFLKPKTCLHCRIFIYFYHFFVTFKLYMEAEGTVINSNTLFEPQV